VSVSGLEDLADREAIREVIGRYAVGLDSRDFDLVGTCFAPDAEADYSGVKVLGGATRIVEWLRAAFSPVVSMHVMTSTKIDLAVDEARTLTYAIVHLVDEHEDDLRVRVRGLHYQDHFVRLATGWAIQSRVHRAILEYHAAAVDPSLAPAVRDTPTPNGG